MGNSIRAKAFLIDLSGTLHVGSSPTPGAVQALQRLRDARIPFRFCSNTSQQSTQDLREKLLKMGFEVRENEMWTSLGALRDVVKERGLRRPFFLMSDSAKEEFAYLNPPVDDCFSLVNFNPDHFDSVLVGLAPEMFSYDRLTAAFRVLTSKHNTSHPHPPLLTCHRARYVRTSDGELSLGPGPFISALEFAASGDVRAEAIGKPEKAFFARVLNSLRDDLEIGNIDDRQQWKDVAVIGDDVKDDLGEGAIEFGLRRVLVQTGKYRKGDEHRHDAVPPDEIYESFAAFVEEVLSKVKG